MTDQEQFKCFSRVEPKANAIKEKGEGLGAEMYSATLQ